MSGRGVRVLFVVFFIAYTVLLTYPGLLWFNRIRPFVFGLPFTMAWIALWIVLGFIVFLITNAAVERENAETGVEDA
jgi:hypothetical protein